MKRSGQTARANPSYCFIKLLLLFSVSGSARADVSSDEIQGLVNQGKLQDALEQTNQQLSKDRGNVTFLFLKGLILTKSNQLEQARQVFERLTEQHPDLPEPYNNLAVVYAALGEFDKAGGELQKAINTHPGYATVHENIGDIYAKMASRAYNQALQLHGENKSAKTKLSLISDLFSLPEEASVTGSQTESLSELTTTQAALADDTQAQVKQPDTSGTDGRVAKDVENRLKQWASAWSAQDARAYLSFYAEEFTPPQKQSRAVWEASRTQRISAPQFIRLDVSNVEVIMYGQERAQAIFSQKYQSDTYNDRVTKILLLKNVNDKWYIVEERLK